MAEAKKSRTGSRGTRAAVIGISLIALLMSCSDMLTGSDMTTKIGTQVAVANAAQVTVTVQPDPNMTAGGTPSPWETRRKRSACHSASRLR